ncbi:endo alpha-1,4 polygalactosaminidase [Leifsonia sp. YIM 134122]|uniref:Endo alpha-1,4 polygalactosaminidase n=1 Tax=Leifsonia stereocauli TaxID=3134136 RepID=A0ABU9W632_9MICO
MSSIPRRVLTAALAVSLAAASVAGVAMAADAGTDATTTAGATTTWSASAASAAAKKVTLPPVNGRFDYQLGGAYTPASSVRIVARDSTAEPATGKYNICYVNAYQTQPDDVKTWSGRNSDLILRNSKGVKVGDPEWDEYLLDTSTAAKRTRIAAIMNSWIDGCAEKGFQAIEPDNLDSWTRSKSAGKQLLTKAHNVALAQLLAAHAHGKGLAIAQKNTPQLGTAGKKTVGFDFAIAEECQMYTECAAYTNVFGRNVIEIEYTDNPKSAYTTACKKQGTTISVILRDRDVVAKGKPDYVYKSC